MVKMKHKILLLLHYFTGNLHFIAHRMHQYALLYASFSNKNYKNDLYLKKIIKMSLDGWLETKNEKTSFEKNVERPVSGTNSFFDSASS